MEVGGRAKSCVLMVGDGADNPGLNENENRIESNTAYKTVARKSRPVPGITPENAKTIRKYPKDIMKNLPTVPLVPPPFRDGERVTRKRLDAMRINSSGFLTAEEVLILEHVLLQNEKTLAFDLSHVGRFKDTYFSDYKMATIPHVPWQEKNIPVPPALFDKINKIIQEKLENGTYEKAEGTSYRSKWFAVAKKEKGDVRLVHSLEPLNRVTIQDVGTIPQLEEYAAGFGAKSIYTMLDLKSGYDCRVVDPSSRDMTTFSTPRHGLLRITVLPIGYTNSVSEFQRTMIHILAPEIPHVTDPFLDDCPVKGPPTRYEQEDGTYETVPGHPNVRRFVFEHAQDVNRVLHRLGHAGASVSAKKIQLGVPEAKIVGQICNYEGRLPDEDRVRKITDWKTPRNTTELRGFLGVCAGVKIWIEGYSRVARPLHRLLNKDALWTWGAEEEEAVDRLKELVTSAPCLREIDYTSDREVIVAVDSSNIAVGFILSQMDEQGRRRPARYGSLTFNAREARYSQPKLELFGLYRALRKLRIYIVGVKKLVVEVDAKYIKGMLNAPDEVPNTTLNRWVEGILMYNFVLRHVPAKDFGATDGLSRRPAGDESDSDDSDEERDRLGEVPKLRLEGETSSACLLASPGNAIGPWIRHVPLVGVFDQLDEDETEEVDVEAEATIKEKFKTPGRRHMNGWTLEEELREVDKFLKTLEKPSVLSAADLKSFLRYALRFFVQNGRLYRKGKGGRHQRVLWEAERESALKGVHEELGHKGVFSTRRALLDRVWWPCIYEDVAIWVRGCPECQRFSDRKIVLPIQPSIPLQLFRHFYCDVMFMPASSGFKKIVLARDNATGYPEGRMLRKATMTAIAKFLLEEVISRWGAIEQITTDNGPEFGAAVDELVRRYGVRRIPISPYNSRAQGVIEKGHHPFRKTLLKTCGDDPSAWANHFYHGLWVDRATVRKETGYSPFEAAHGYPPLLPIDALHLTFAWDAKPMTTEELTLARLRMMEKRPEDEALILERVARSRWRNKERFEREHAHTLFRGDVAPGTLVLVRNTAIEKDLDRKHKPRWLGPLVVVERRSQSGSYVLAELDGTVLATRFAAFRIIPYHQREGLTFRLDEFLKPVGVEENGKERDAGPENTAEGSEEEELVRAKIRENWERLTGADGIVRPRRRFVGIDPRVLARQKTNLANISSAYMHAGIALASSSFAAIDERRSLAMLLPSGGRENADLGRFEEAENDFAVEKGELGVDEVSQTPRGPWAVKKDSPEMETTPENMFSDNLRHTKDVLKRNEVGRGLEAHSLLSRVRSRRERGPRITNEIDLEDILRHADEILKHTDDLRHTVEGGKSKAYGFAAGPLAVPPLCHSPMTPTVLGCALRAPALALSHPNMPQTLTFSCNMSRDPLTAVDLFVVRRGGLNSQAWDRLIQSQAHSPLFSAFLDCNGTVTFPSIHFARLPYNLPQIQGTVQRILDAGLNEDASVTLERFPFISPRVEDHYPYATVENESRQRQQLLKPGMLPPPAPDELVKQYGLASPGSRFTFGVPYHIAFERFELRCCMRCGSPACDTDFSCQVTSEYTARLVRSLYSGRDYPVTAISVGSRPVDDISSQLDYLSCLPGTLFLLVRDHDIERRRQDMHVCVVCGLDHWEWSQDECELWRRFQAAQLTADIDQWTKHRQRVLHMNPLYRRLAGNEGDVMMDCED
jgi:hypothetical protein